MNKVRELFPTLIKYKNKIFCENAGGSQIPKQVITSLNNYLIDSYVQPDSTNYISKNTTSKRNEIFNIVNIILNNKTGKLIFGSSASQLMYILANSLEPIINTNKKNQIILSTFSHESCISPFERIAINNNNIINYWNIDANYKINYNSLFELINEDTILIVLPHVSNVLGNILDIKYLNRKIKEINPNIKIFVDGVAFMPHRLVDVDDLGIDFYTISFYKFCGLRISILYLKDENILDKLNNQNHYFFNEKGMEKKLELGGINFENASSIIGIKDYLIDISKIFNYDENFNYFDRKLMKFVMSKIEDHEKKLITIFDEIIKEIPDVNYLVDKDIDRIPIFSLYYKKYDHYVINLILNEFGLISKYGTFYCNRLLNYLNISEAKGVLRISLMHYNTLEEVKLIANYLNIFRLEYPIFDYKIIDNIFLSNKVKSSFNSLTIDNFYNTTRRCRAFSLIDIKNYKIIGNLPFYQSKTYNNFNGNVLREYKNIDDQLLNDISFKSLINIFANIITNGNPIDLNFIQVHQIRVYADIDNTITPVPEGIHQDGFNYVGIYIINRENIKGGINTIYNEGIEIYSKELEIGSSVILNDRKLHHHVTNIELIDIEKIGYRDIFVFTSLN